MKLDQAIKLAKKTGKFWGLDKVPQYKKSNQMIPPKSLIPWIKSKNIKGRNDKGRFITDKSLSFAMAISIHRKGIEGTSFFTRPLWKNVDVDLKKDLSLKGIKFKIISRKLISKSL